MNISANSDDANLVVEAAQRYGNKQIRLGWQISIESAAVAGTVVVEGMPRGATEYKTLFTFDLSDAELRFGIAEGKYERFRFDHSALAADTDYTIVLDPLE